VITRIAGPASSGSGTATQAARSAPVTNRSFTIFEPALTMNSDTPNDEGASGSKP
jgi:hypothetical protein